MVYMVTFTINIPHFFVSIYTSTMDPLGQSGNLCLGHLLVPQTVCRWEVHDIHVILAG